MAVMGPWLAGLAKGACTAPALHCTSLVLHCWVQVEDDLTEDQMELLTDYGLEDFLDREQIKGTL
jgi:hypothetical protein